MSVYQITISELSVLMDSLYVEYDFNLLENKENISFSADLKAASKKVDKAESAFYAIMDDDVSEILRKALMLTIEGYIGKAVKFLKCDTEIGEMYFSSNKTLVTLPVPRAEFFASVITRLEQEYQPCEKVA